MTMEFDDPIIVDPTGKIIEGKAGLKPTSEVDMHLEAYHQRPEINAVLHAHPPYATALTIAGIPFPTNLLPEVLIALGDVPTAPYATPGSRTLAESIQNLIRDHNSVLLSNHGSISVGRTLEEALIRLERLEHAAYIYHLAQALGEPQPLQAKNLEILQELGDKIRS
jgi:L-fuculose-phosphate aldolase